MFEDTTSAKLGAAIVEDDAVTVVFVGLMTGYTDEAGVGIATAVVGYIIICCGCSTIWLLLIIVVGTYGGP